MIIALTGLKGSGKDTVADYIVTKYGYKKETFAEPLKNALKCLFGLNDNNLYENKESKLDDWYGVTPRQLMQYVGTELLRDQMYKLIPELKKNIFVKNLENKIKKGGNFVISDLRMENEYELIKKYGGVVININRGLISVDTHSTENTILDYDYILNNLGTIENLYDNIDIIMKKINC